MRNNDNAEIQFKPPSPQLLYYNLGLGEIFEAVQILRKEIHDSYYSVHYHVFFRKYFALAMNYEHSSLQ